MDKIIKFFFILMLSGCSFDNKTGIWEDSNEVDLVKQKQFKDFETLYTVEKSFNEIIKPNKNLKISIDESYKILKWEQENLLETNNLVNFSYKDLNEIDFKSRKLSKYSVTENILFDGNNLLLTDDKGNIIVYSSENKKVIFKYNFYRKKYKKIKKILSTIIENNIIFVSDNLGYIYAIDYNSQRLIWAHNYKIPFRSNIKLLSKHLITSNQDNSLMVLDKLTGERIKIIPTEETIIKNEFKNSIAVDQKSIYFLNTFGSLYSIDRKSLSINWLVSLNENIDLNNNNLFYSNPIIANNNLIIVSTNPYLYIINGLTGVTIYKLPITSLVKPIIFKNNLFLVTNDNLLVCLDIKGKKVNYSINIDEEIFNVVGKKKTITDPKYLFLVNQNLYLYLNENYTLNFSTTGKLKKIIKLKEKLKSSPIFINESIFYINKKNQLIVLN